MRKSIRNCLAERLTVILFGCLVFLAVSASVSADDGPLQAQRQLTVGVPESFPPYYQLDENGRPSGFAVAVMDEVARQVGFRVTYRVARNGAANLKALMAGDIDIIPSLGINDYRKQFVRFTQPVDTFRVVLFVRDDTHGVTGIDDLAGRPIAVVVDNVGYRHLEKRPDVQLKVFPLFTDALFGLLSGDVDAFAYPEPVTWKLAREAGVADHIKVAAKPLFEIKRAMAVRKDRVELLAVLDRAVGDFLASPEYQKVYLAWFGMPVPFWTQQKVAVAMGALFILSLMAMAWWRYRSIVSLNRALKASEALFRAVVDNSPTKIHIKDMEGRYTLINPEAEKLFGITDAEGRGKTSYDLFKKDVADSFTAHDRAIIESGEATEDEEDFISEDGVRTYLTTKFPILDNGKVTGVGAIGTEITDRKRAEKAREMLSQAVEAVPVGIALFDKDDRLVFFNERYRDFMEVMNDILKPGVTFEKMIRTMVERAPVKDAIGREEEYIHERIKHHRKPTRPNDIRRKNKWLLANETRLADGSIFTIITDVTKHKKAEGDLRKAHDELEKRVAERTKELAYEVTARMRSEERLVDALESIADGAILLDADDRVVIWNSNYEKSFAGILDILVPGVSFYDVMRFIAERGLVRGAKEDVEASFRMRVHQHRHYKEPFELETVDGRWALINEYKTKDGGTFIVRTDITNRKKAEQALIEAKRDAEAANRVKSKFLANMSHELRTPLNAIIGFSEITQSQGFGPIGIQKYVEYAADINYSGIHLLAIINDILDLSAVEAEKLELNIEQVGLVTLVTVAEQFLSQKADDEGVRIINTIGMDTPMIMADKRRVKQVLINLVSNAVKFTPRDGSVTIGAGLEADGCMAVTIADTGVGMDEAEMAEALEPFGQTDSTVSRQHEGTGLGLPLSKSLMEAHGGTLEIDSDPGKGTAVTVRFPAEQVVIGSEIEEGSSKDSSADKRLH